MTFPDFISGKSSTAIRPLPERPRWRADWVEVLNSAITAADNIRALHSQSDLLRLYRMTDHTGIRDLFVQDQSPNGIKKFRRKPFSGLHGELFLALLAKLIFDFIDRLFCMELQKSLDYIALGFRFLRTFMSFFLSGHTTKISPEAC